MDAGSIIGLVVVLIACVAFALLYEEPTIKGTVSTIDELPTQTLLMGSTLWQITILRKSGYLHDVREVLASQGVAAADSDYKLISDKKELEGAVMELRDLSYADRVTISNRTKAKHSKGNWVSSVRKMFLF